MGNCSYGKTLLAKDKHLTIKYCFEESALDSIQFPCYVKVNQIDEDLYKKYIIMENLDSAVRKDRLRKFYSNVHLWLPSKACDDRREEKPGTMLANPAVEIVRSTIVEPWVCQKWNINVTDASLSVAKRVSYV
ncbi:unnamed protein product [Clavelina lepadiformis]|uniref:Uncharacterized protein n=1 Tax=Clavelina lepadiformis TaxID=159417 RepID=A0ABP0FQV1_CLALP